jgi:hypothetical protein
MRSWSGQPVGLLVRWCLERGTADYDYDEHDRPIPVVALHMHKRYVLPCSFAWCVCVTANLESTAGHAGESLAGNDCIDWKSTISISSSPEALDGVAWRLAVSSCGSADDCWLGAHLSVVGTLSMMVSSRTEIDSFVSFVASFDCDY